MVEANDS